MTSRIGTAVIGAGSWGTTLVRHAAGAEGLRLQYVCDLDERRARAALAGDSWVRTSASFERVLADPAVAAVMIATPAVSHLPVAMAAVAAGKHVLVEHPLAANLSDGRALVKAAARRRLVLMLDHTSCYQPVAQRLRSLVRGGTIGDLQYLDSVRMDLGQERPDVDVLWDLASPDLSILDAVLPAGVFPVAVAAHGSDPAGTGRVCLAHLSIRLSTGALAHVHVNRLSAVTVRTVVVGGSLRTVMWDDLNPTRRLSTHDRHAPREDRQARGGAREPVAMPVPAAPERAAPHTALRGVLTEFVAAIRDRRTPLTDGASGLRLLALLEAASASLRSGGGFVPVEPVMTLLTGAVFPERALTR